MTGLEHSTYVTVDSKPVVPECITRFSPGTRVEVKALRSSRFAVRAVETDPMHIFGEENWRLAV
jgi:hypothetical protein